MRWIEAKRSADDPERRFFVYGEFSPSPIFLFIKTVKYLFNNVLYVKINLFIFLFAWKAKYDLFDKNLMTETNLLIILSFIPTSDGASTRAQLFFSDRLRHLGGNYRYTYSSEKVSFPSLIFCQYENVLIYIVSVDLSS